MKRKTFYFYTVVLINHIQAANFSSVYLHCTHKSERKKKWKWFSEVDEDKRIIEKFLKNLIIVITEQFHNFWRKVKTNNDCSYCLTHRNWIS